MKFETTQRIGAPVSEVEAAMFDARYPAFLVLHHGVLLECEALEQREQGGQLIRRVRYRSKPVIERVGPRTVSPEWFAFIEHSRYDRARHEMHFENIPTSQGIAKMLSNTGVIRLRSVGAQTERTTAGDIRVHMPLFMKPVAVLAERVIQSEGLKILEGEAPVLGRFITEVLRKQIA